MTETWQTVRDHSNYEISTNGVVRNKRTQRELKAQVDTHGYYTVLLDKKRERIHRLMMLTYAYRPDARFMHVDHINFVKSDNRLCNLRWLDPAKSYRRQPQSPDIATDDASDDVDACYWAD